MIGCKQVGTKALPWRSGGPQFYHPRGVRVEKDRLFLSGRVAPPLYPVRCIFKSAEGWSSNLPLVWIWMQASSLPPLNDLSNSCTSTRQASLPCSDGFLELTVVSQHPPGFPLYLWSPTGISTTTCAYFIPIRITQVIIAKTDSDLEAWIWDLGFCICVNSQVMPMQRVKNTL